VLAHKVSKTGPQCTDRKVSLCRGAFSFVELIIVIGIVGLLFSLLLPATHAARSAARRIQCDNNLRQIGYAVLNHEAAIKRLPTSGWGFGWMGVSDLGSGVKQPGGWIYCILPYCESGAVHDLAPSSELVRQRYVDLQTFVQSPVSLFFCPERPRPDGAIEPTAVHIQAYGFATITQATKTDYAGNHGSDAGFVTFPGPRDLDSGLVAFNRISDATNGLFFPRSAIRLRDVTDGTAHTILVGEKWQAIRNTQQFSGSDQSMYSGHCADLVRVTGFPISVNGSSIGFKTSFGSPHFDQCGFCFLDGSVRRIAYSADPYTFKSLGSRNGGEPLFEGD
jgi:hypothetical protein